jgi:outer membrane protein OmpA-like peptidoglycan-associated protein/tetratricopeptide (TPR) repeat protein
MKHAVGVLLLALISVWSVAQKNKNQVVGDKESIAYEQGKSYYDKANYAEAIPYFEETLKYNPTNADALYSVGLSYRYTGKYQEAIDKLKKLEEVNANYWAWYYYELGIAYEETNQFENAVKAYENFIQKYPHDASRRRYIYQGKTKKNYALKSPEVRAAANTMEEPVNLNSPINSKWGDYSPQSSPNGRIIYFTSKRKDARSAGQTDGDFNETNGWDEDVYIIEQEGASWTTPKQLPEPINSDGHDFGASFSGDGQSMVYVACGRDGGIGSCDLYLLNLEGNTWSAPVNMGNLVNSKDWDSQPTMSADGSTIIFASDRENGFGGADLYLITKSKYGDWGVASNLGPVLNTPFTEKSPFLSPDGKTLYFTSDGHPGHGGLDLFMSVFDNGKWSEPVNLGRPLNSENDDAYFTIGGSGEVGYFASTRKGTLGDLDLYSIKIPEFLRPQPTVVVSGVVTNAKTGNPVGAYVMVEDLLTGEMIAVNKSNSATGKYLVVLPAGKTYSVSANKEAFFFHSERFDVPSTAKFQEITKNIALKPIEKGAKVVLNNIFFETGKATLSTESRVELGKAIDLMKANPTMIIEVGGHTDNVGDDAYNMKLSHDRAKAVRDYLVAGGIASTRVQSKGYGETNPVATNDTEDGRKANRRTEFVILEF